MNLENQWLDKNNKEEKKKNEEKKKKKQGRKYEEHEPSPHAIFD